MVVEEAESAVVVTWKGTATVVVDVDAKLEVESEVIFFPFFLLVRFSFDCFVSVSINQANTKVAKFVKDTQVQMPRLPNSPYSLRSRRGQPSIQNPACKSYVCSVQYDTEYLCPS